MYFNLRAYAALHQGDRKYMEDDLQIHYELHPKTKEVLYAYFGVFDGHGGDAASKFAKENLHKNITKEPSFWSKSDSDILDAIRIGFRKTHEQMWKDLASWPKTSRGFSCTSGTTVSVAFIINKKLYTGHVGDSAIVLSSQEDGLGKGDFLSKKLTEDHKPSCPREHARIESAGGSVAKKGMVHRVVWYRPCSHHRGAVKPSTPTQPVAFLAVARALGDLWSYNSESRQYAVSPEPDVSVTKLDVTRHRALILGSDGLWNLMTPDHAGKVVEQCERQRFRSIFYYDGGGNIDTHYNDPALSLVDTVLARWNSRSLRSDNVTALVVMIDPPAPGVHDVSRALRTIRMFQKECLRHRNELIFCGVCFLKKRRHIYGERPVSPATKYILNMTGVYEDSAIDQCLKDAVISENRSKEYTLSVGSHREILAKPRVKYPQPISAIMPFNHCRAIHNMEKINQKRAQLRHTRSRPSGWFWEPQTGSSSGTNSKETRGGATTDRNTAPGGTPEVVTEGASKSVGKALGDGGSTFPSTARHTSLKRKESPSKGNDRYDDVSSTVTAKRPRNVIGEVIHDRSDQGDSTDEKTSARLVKENTAGKLPKDPNDGLWENDSDADDDSDDDDDYSGSSDDDDPYEDVWDTSEDEYESWQEALPPSNTKPSSKAGAREPRKGSGYMMEVNVGCRMMVPYSQLDIHPIRKSLFSKEKTMRMREYPVFHPVEYISHKVEATHAYEEFLDNQKAAASDKSNDMDATSARINTHPMTEQAPQTATSTGKPMSTKVDPLGKVDSPSLVSCAKLLPTSTSTDLAHMDTSPIDKLPGTVAASCVSVEEAAAACSSKDHDPIPVSATSLPLQTSEASQRIFYFGSKSECSGDNCLGQQNGMLKPKTLVGLPSCDSKSASPRLSPPDHKGPTMVTRLRSRLSQL